MAQPIKPKKHHHRIVPVALITFCLPFALIGAFMLVANIVVHDESRPNFPELIMPNLTVSKTNNAFYDLQVIYNRGQSADTEYGAVQKMIDAPWDDTAITALITSHQADINDFRVAATRSTYQNPIFANTSTIKFATVQLTPISGINDVARTVALQAEQKARNGDVRAGLDEAIDIVRVGQLMQNAREFLIANLIAGNIKLIGFEAIRKIAIDNTIDTGLAKEFADRLSSYVSTRDGLVTALKMEAQGDSQYFDVPYNKMVELYGNGIVTDVNGNIQWPSTWDQIMANVAHTPVNARNPFEQLIAEAYWAPITLSGLTHYSYLPHQTMRLALQQRLAIVHQADHPCNDLPPAQDPVRYNTPVGLIGFFVPNSIGKLMVNIGAVAYGGASEKLCNQNAALAAAQIALAVSAYAKDRGQLPATLSDLVPAYLSNIPIDPYITAAMKYSAANKIIYSVGAGKQDLGGGPVYTGSSNDKNPTFSIAK